jgi:glycosyltransferase involved in cell wall biosynthesis
MLPWVLSYYPLVPLAAGRIAPLMAPVVDAYVSPEHVLLHSHRIGREFLAEATLLVARRRRLPFVLTPHHHPRWKGYRYSAWIRVYQAADALLAQTQAEKRELENLGVAASRIHVTGTGTEPLPSGDPARFRTRLAQADAPLVLFIGQLFRYKGVVELLAAVDSLRARGSNAELVFVGPHTRFSRRLFSGGGSDRWLHVLGHVDEQTKADALAAADVVILPSHQEAFGRVFLEAWSFDKPVIGADIPAVREVLDDGRAGLLVEPGSVTELASALESLLNNKALARRLAAEGARRVAGLYSWDRVAAEVEEAYQSLLQ